MVQEDCEAMLGYAEMPESRRRTCVPSRRAIASVSAAGLVFGAILVGCTFMATRRCRNGLVLGPTRRSASSIVSHAVSRSKTRIETSNASNIVAPTELTGRGRASCLKFTGGTCNVKGCYSWRHAACERSGLLHHCNCPGGCVGADFSCHNSQYRLIRQGFHLSNGRWPDSYLYVPLSRFLHSLRVGSIHTGDNRFILFEVPGELDGLKKYTISSSLFPGRQIAMVPDVLPGDYYNIDDVESEDPMRLLWTICRPRGHSGPNVQIGTRRQGYFVWAYVHSFSYIVHGWPESVWGPPDIRAQWRPSIPLGMKFDDCPAP
eukprot:TRINITY_DN2935_c0_g2_i1.p1 TRINITY_DN2935_c0_g2~~TRINITY_DN2935_c0_g2_i1.p1  ORF type:complete len:318 (-),score=19.15 TRINITY_DN2935_c0_g2_i1:45-998(-)